MTALQPSADRLLEIVDGMHHQPVLVVADLVADLFVHGSPKRISREAPVLILRYEGEELVPGGGANAIANVEALGGRPVTVGVIGRDDNGSRLVAELGRRGISTEGITEIDDHATTTKIRLMAGGRHAARQQVVRYDIESSVAGREDAGMAIGDAIDRSVGRAEVAVLSDYGYGAVPPSVVRSCRAAVGETGTVLCDSRYRLSAFEGLDGATPNEGEAEALLGRSLGEAPDDVAANARELRERLGLRFLLITRGSAGMVLADDFGCALVPIHGTDEVADVTGAGDTVIGTLSLALAAGASRLEATHLANYAGGIVVMKRGTATVSADELRTAIEDDPRPREEARWVTS